MSELLQPQVLRRRSRRRRGRRWDAGT